MATLAGVGFVAFLLAGYVGSGTGLLALFAWYTAIGLLLGATVFRHPSLRHYLILDLVLQVVALGLVAACWWSGEVEAAWRWIIRHPEQAAIVTGGVIAGHVVAFFVLTLIHLYLIWRIEAIVVFHGLGFLGALLGGQATITEQQL